MNTAMMFTRVSLLLFVTVLFAGMWATDCPDCRTDADKLMARRESTPQWMRPAVKTRTAEISRTTAAKPISLESIPLPSSIEPGTYVVVDQSGATQQMTISAATSTKSSNLVPVDQYTVRQGDRRWHFIRLDGVVSPKVAQPTRRVPVADLR